MDYKKYLFAPDKQRTPYWKQVWKFGKIFIYTFFIITFLWGCGQMFDPNVSTSGKTTGAGSIFGTYFELLFPGDDSKTHFINGEEELPFNGISSWDEAWTVTKSPFFGLFVYPIAALLWVLLKGFSGGIAAEPTAAAAIGAMFVTALIIKLITLAFSWKSQKNQEKMQAIQLKQGEIQAKYKGSADPQARQKMQLELMGLYKKEGVKPLASFANLFLSMPFLYAMFMVVRSMRILKEQEFGAISFTITPWEGLKAGDWAYLAIVFVYLPIQIISMLLPMYLNRAKKKAFTKESKAAQKKQLITQLIMTGVFMLLVFTIGSGVAIYWIFSGALQIGQTVLFHYINKNAKYKKKK
ncbi:membrane protein insertase YidC [Spiroplasma endosymbiont of Asaphidion curtum]|uniref:membrane protein insertase YidC n=1 Tax=Spiroplasma endosymbiont of Asaphidion curtum TaxID=3066281 RepID=UPI00313DE973